MSESLPILLVNGALSRTGAPDLTGTMAASLQCVPAHSDTWRESLHYQQDQPFAAVVVSYQGGGIPGLLAEIAADYPGPVIAIGPDDAAIAASACADGAYTYVVEENGFWQSLVYPVKCAQLDRQITQIEEFKDQFISVASHELKNPLAALRGYAELLLRRIQRTSGDDRTVRGLNTILQQSLRMQQILDDLHDLARLSRGQLELHRRRYELEKLLQRAAESIERGVEEHKVKLTIDNPALLIESDGERLLRVFSKLIAIAADHNIADTPVEVQVSCIGEKPRQVQIMISSYNGLTIEEVKRAFGNFYLGSNATAINATERLALHVGAQLVRLHRGQMRYSRLPEGDGVFEVVLPLA